MISLLGRYKNKKDFAEAIVFEGEEVDINKLSDKGRPPSMLERLNRITRIIEQVDNRCMAVDGPVSSTLEEMTQEEISEIYRLSKGDDWQ